MNMLIKNMIRIFLRSHYNMLIKAFDVHSAPATYNGKKNIIKKRPKKLEKTII
jgi:hypothetical protein